MSAELELHKINAANINIDPSALIKQVLSIKFTDAELAAIMTVLGIVLRAAGLQGLYDFVAMLIKLEQQYIATKAPAPVIK